MGVVGYEGAFVLMLHFPELFVQSRFSCLTSTAAQARPASEYGKFGTIMIGIICTYEIGFLLISGGWHLVWTSLSGSALQSGKE